MTRVTRVSVIVTAWLIIGTLTNSIYGLLTIDESPITNQNAYLLTNSSAAVAGSYIRVIEQARGASGQAWYLTPQYTSLGFTATLDLEFIGNLSAFGDGMTFVVCGQDPQALRTRYISIGGNMALTGLSNFAAVVFDITSGLVRFCTANTTEVQPDRGAWDQFCIQTSVLLENDIYNVSITFSPTQPGKADWNVRINGDTYYFLGQRDVISSSSNSFYVGFTGASGMYTAELRVNAWTLDVIAPCDTNNGNCSEFATCTFPGAVECTCMTGYDGDGYNCSKIVIPPVAEPVSNPAVQPIDTPNLNSTAPLTDPPLSTLVPAIVVPVAAAVVGAILLAVLLTRRNRRNKNKLKDKDTDLSQYGNVPKYGNVPGVSTTNPVSTEYGKIPDNLDGDAPPVDEEEINPVGIKPSEIDKRMHIPYKSLVFTKEIGSGSYGKVFVGSWRGAQVAIKVNNTVTDMEGFLAEAKLTLGITPHPNLVQTFGVSLDGAYPCIVLEFCGGGSLDTLVFNKESAVSAEKKREYALKIAYGLTHLHNNNIVHRDLAVRNILLTSEGQPKISDFGMSRVIQDESSKGKTKTNVGPLRWMAPESLKDRTYSVKSDVWSYGMLLWELLAGQEPHKDEDQLLIGVKIRDEGFTPVIPDDCDPVLREVMQMCWKRDPNERPTVEEVAAYIRSH